MKINQTRKRIHVGLAFACIVSLSASADDVVWDPPGGGSSSWTDDGNWVGGTAPVDDTATDTAVFSGTVAYEHQPSLDALTVQSVNGVRIGGAGTVSVTLGSNEGIRTTSGSTPGNSTTIEMSNISGLAVGQQVTTFGMERGTFITDITGTTITLSRPTTGTTIADGAEIVVTSSLRLGDGGLTLAADTVTNNNTITAPIVLSTSQVWNNESSRDLNVQGSIFLDNHTLTLSGVSGSDFAFNGQQGGTARLRQTIAGTGDIVVDTDGRVVFGSSSGNPPEHEFTGGVTLNSGEIQLHGGNSGSATGGNLGTGTLTINGGRITGNGNIANRELTVSDQVWNADWEFGGSRSVHMGTGAISLGTAAGTSRTLSTNASLDLIIGGTITNGVTADSFVKSGSSTLVLEGASTYTGSTTVDEGTLVLQSSGSINGSSGITIQNGATLRQNSSEAVTTSIGYGTGGGTLTGDGDVDAAVTLTGLDNVLSPGNSPGIQNFGTSQTWESFTYIWETNDFTGAAAGSDFDQILIDGSLALTGGSGDYQIDITSLDGGNAAGDVINFSEVDRTWTILTANAGITGFNGANWNLDTSEFSNVYEGTWTLDQSGNDLVLSYVAIPEPSTIALALISLIAALAGRRRLTN